ncbi:MULTISPECIES: ABC transporter substrate-binding protein [unclassified Isoptericola]|uniref:ABC transporter substrate-binding protein n=1 Tax=unclassified Isoptericola TaxID=2623355 RepID=UPI0036611403
MNRRSSRIAVGIVAAAACTSMLSGCLGEPGGGSDAADGSTSIVAVNNGEIGRITGAQNPGSQIAMALCEPLTGIEEDGTVFMRGAESLESDDQVHWTVKVADGHTFSDGTPITAKTYVDTFNFVGAGVNAMPSNYAYGPIKGYDELNPAEGKAKATEFSGITLVDESTFTIETKAPNNDVPYILSQLAFCPMPESAFADPLAYDKDPVGNGVYTLEKLDPQVEAVLKKDPEYQGWVPDGAADQITFRVYTDTNTAYQDVVAGNADVLRDLPPGLIAQGRNALGDDGLTAIDRNALAAYFAWPTYLDEKFPIEVRQAFSMIVDRETISKDLFKGATLPWGSLMPNSVDAYREDACGKYCTYDPEAAKALIEKSGFTGTIPLNYSSESTTDAATALAISNSAKEIGLVVEPKPVPAAALSETVNSYGLDGPVIQLWGSSFPAASEWVASVYIDANYRLKYSDPVGEAAVAAALAAKTPDESIAQWQKAEDRILADQVLQPLYQQVRYIAHTPCVVPHAAGGDQQIYRTEVTCS